MLKLYTSPDSNCQFIWHNALGEKSDHQVKEQQLQPGLWQLQTDCHPGDTGRLKICGQGNIFDLEY